MSDTTGPIDVQLSTPPPPHAGEPTRRRAQTPLLPPARLGWILLAAVFGDLALRTGVGSLSATLTVVLIVGPVLGSTLRSHPLPRLFLGLAMVFALWLPIRASIWLTCLNFGAVVACLVAAAITHRHATWRWNTSTLGLAIVRVAMGFLFANVVARSVGRLHNQPVARLGPIVRGVAIASLPIMVLGALLASADQVFAQSIALDLDASSGVQHVVLAACVAAAIAGLVAMTSVPVNETFSERRPLGVIETIILLGAIAALYSVFAFVQLVSALGGADGLLRDQGLTYAEYARSGFFQLLWVAALTAMLLGAVRMLTAPARPLLDRIVRLLGASVALLTIVIVAVAIVRLSLYTDEFGQTMLRWYCTAFAWMLGGVFVALALAHIPRVERLLPWTLLVVAAGTLFAVNAVNPEARVAQHNVERSDAVERLDADYLARLSADAWPTLLRNESLMSQSLNGFTSLSERCAAAGASNGYGFAGFNLAKHRLECS